MQNCNGTTKVQKRPTLYLAVSSRLESLLPKDLGSGRLLYDLHREGGHGDDLWGTAYTCLTSWLASKTFRKDDTRLGLILASEIGMKFIVSLLSSKMISKFILPISLSLIIN